MSKTFASIKNGLRQAIAHQRGKQVRGMRLYVPIKSTDVRFRIEPYLKARASEVLAARGLSMNHAIRLFLHQVVAQQGLPFDVKAPNTATIAAMREARSMKRAKFGSARELFNDLEKAGAAKARKPVRKTRG